MLTLYSGNLKLQKATITKNCVNAFSHVGKPLVLSTKPVSLFALKKKSLLIFSIDADRVSLIEVCKDCSLTIIHKYISTMLPFLCV